MKLLIPLNVRLGLSQEDAARYIGLGRDLEAFDALVSIGAMPQPLDLGVVSVDDVWSRKQIDEALEKMIELGLALGPASKD